MTREQQPPFGLRLPPDLKIWVKMMARQERRSMNNFLINLVRQAMESEVAASKK
ncbi:Arc family DNA-binding protein [Salipiger sp.]|uniref:Arc family DNA-binding protein n=1 Tax=Salipiger sp. TaxID=2078585 RepID=UPI003A970CE2